MYFLFQLYVLYKVESPLNSFRVFIDVGSLILFIHLPSGGSHPTKVSTESSFTICLAIKILFGFSGFTKPVKSKKSKDKLHFYCRPPVNNYVAIQTSYTQNEKKGRHTQKTICKVKKQDGKSTTKEIKNLFSKLYLVSK